MELVFYFQSEVSIKQISSFSVAQGLLSVRPASLVLLFFSCQ